VFFIVNCNRSFHQYSIPSRDAVDLGTSGDNSENKEQQQDMSVGKKRAAGSTNDDTMDRNKKPKADI
jgi:hypothetical protein